MREVDAIYFHTKRLGRKEGRQQFIYPKCEDIVLISYYHILSTAKLMLVDLHQDISSYNFLEDP